MVEEESVSGLTKLIWSLSGFVGLLLVAYLVRFIPDHKVSLGLTIIALAGAIVLLGIAAHAG